MSNSEWYQVGFGGPLVDVEAARANFQFDPNVGGMLPEAGQPPYQVFVTEDLYVFGVVANGPLVTPPGLKEVDPALVRIAMGGSSF